MTTFVMLTRLHPGALEFARFARGVGASGDEAN